MARSPNSHHVLPLFCDDLIASTVDMTPACFGAYVRLICYAWTRGGIPDDEGRCSRIAGGMEPGDWPAIRSRLVVLEDGRLSHQRLELERAKVAELKEKKAEAGRKGGIAKANGKQTPSRTLAEGVADGWQTPSKNLAPTPTPKPTPSSSSRCSEEEQTDARAAADADWRKAGWVHDEWASLVATWNRTERTVPWTHLAPPHGFADLAAAPGWLDSARAAIDALPACKRFDQPVPWTQFVRDMDRILAGEFREPKERRQEVAAGPRAPRRGNL